MVRGGIGIKERGLLLNDWQTQNLSFKELLGRGLVLGVDEKISIARCNDNIRY